METVRYIIKKYTKNLSTEVAERFIKNGLITGRKDSSEVELELLKLHILLESVMKSLCDTLSASYKQVFLLAKKVIATPTNVPTNSRKPLYYTPHFIGSNHVGLNSQSDEYTDCIKINSDYFDVLESGGGEHRNDINLIEDNKGRTHTKHQTFSYAMAPLHMKAERVKSELHSTIGISQSGSRHQSMSPEKCKVSQHGFFEKNANILSSKGVKPDFRSTDSIEDAYTAIAESFQLLYCRRYA